MMTVDPSTTPGTFHAARSAPDCGLVSQMFGMGTRAGVPKGWFIAVILAREIFTFTSAENSSGMQP